MFLLSSNAIACEECGTDPEIGTDNANKTAQYVNVDFLYPLSSEDSHLDYVAKYNSDGDFFVYKKPIIASEDCEEWYGHAWGDNYIKESPYSNKEICKICGLKRTWSSKWEYEN